MVGPLISLDLMVAMNYGAMATDLTLEELPDSWWRSEAVPTPRAACGHPRGVKRADVDELYDSEQYRPRIRRADGNPMSSPERGFGWRRCLPAANPFGHSRIYQALGSIGGKPPQTLPRYTSMNRR